MLIASFVICCLAVLVGVFLQGVMAGENATALEHLILLAAMLVVGFIGTSIGLAIF